MNFKKLLKNKSRKDLDEIAQNWYSRLNRLKEVIVLDPRHPKHAKAIDLTAEMIIRMMQISQIYTLVMMPRRPKNFKEGGTKISSSGRTAPYL